MPIKTSDQIRNIAIIAHVDHGKTTLVDCMLRQSGIFRENEKVVERVMDSNDLERERGITILSKNTAVYYNEMKINIVDTPGHADFGGEVERVLRMVDGALLLVDAFEGPMAQTKFVLRKALEVGLKVIVVINKIDRPDARVSEVLDEVFDLFVELEADDWQLDFPVIYTSARQGVASLDPEHPGRNMQPLFEMIQTEIPAPSGDPEAPLQLQITTLDYDDYVGRIGIGRISGGTLKAGQQVSLCKQDGSVELIKIGKVWIYEGLKRKEADDAVSVGEIVALAGLGPVNIGETVSDAENPAPLPLLTIDEPTLTMTFMVNDSPFAGREGKYVTSRHLRDRLFKEAETNVSMKVAETATPDAFQVSGRGELHLGILIETMRREGYELQVSKPEPILKKVNGQTYEPYERLFISTPEEFSGRVIENLGRRRAEMLNMHPVGIGQLRIEFLVPARGLVGFRSEFLTETKGEGIMHHLFERYGPWKGEISGRQRGVLIAFETGDASAYGIHNVEERGSLFVQPTEKVYAGMIVGENAREGDLDVNVCKKKHLTNMRASTADEGIKLTPPRLFSLEQAMEYIEDDELVEITPQSIRMRKKILDRSERERSNKRSRDNA
ncbi:GTP-binding protein [Hydrogenispora ethanolica]|uniref:Large ribosomal subunit assembly factor BipA n=1 Tax=Hydrogenispora ethanolica TaxID=1082276 RepID=A0A4R1RK74_HYDET|nr:translational GTPase TypA [Hydrogenispora ethanolica]TCL66581.1 GTP-binding protein [Hydrogenispora ethanolica]